jgi:Ca2+-binding RTX toxin-like protein
MQGRTDLAPLTYDGVYAVGLFSSNHPGGTIQIQSVPAGEYLEIGAETGTRVTVGNPVPGGGRTLQDVLSTVGIGSSIPGSTPQLVVDDSGDTVGRQATFDFDPQVAYGVTGLSPRRIWWNFSAGSTVSVLGGRGNDTFTVQSSAAGVPTALDGGAGDDVLIGNAQGNILIGGAGNDILVGGAGDDTLQGGGGRDLLIGGLGADLLDGGGGEDILIGGYTAYDTKSVNGALVPAVDLDALHAVMREWSRTDLDSPADPLAGYGARVSHLMNGGAGALNGAYLLRSSGGAKATVFDDPFADTLTGGDGIDWFFANKKVDALTDRQGGEDIR